MEQFKIVCGGKFFEFMRMKKVAVKIPNYKFGGIPSGNAIAAQRQPQHAAERGGISLYAVLTVVWKNEYDKTI